MKRRLAIAFFPVLFIVSIALVIGAAYHRPWNGLDLLAWMLMLFAAMRVMRPVRRAEKGGSR